VTFIAVVILAICYFARRPVAVIYHLAYLRTKNHSYATQEDHRMELIKLGYLGQRDFVLERRLLNTNTIHEFVSLKDKVRFKDPYFQFRTDSNNATTIHITAHREDLARWQKIVETFDSRTVR
jgi:hypothetical protein